MRIYLFYVANIMAVDVLTTQGARTSAAILLTKMNRDNSFSACLGLIVWHLIQVILAELNTDMT